MIGTLLQMAARRNYVRALEEERLRHAAHAGLNMQQIARKKVYLIGSLRNASIAPLAIRLREALPGATVFDDWLCAGPHADDAWRDHEKGAGFTYLEALERPAAKHVFEFDKKHLLDSDVVVLVAPAGKSAHLELGWSLGKGKPGYILLDNPDRWDVMYQFATGITANLEELAEMLKEQLYADNP